MAVMFSGARDARRPGRAVRCWTPSQKAPRRWAAAHKAPYALRRAERLFPEHGDSDVRRPVQSRAMGAECRVESEFRRRAAHRRSALPFDALLDGG
jgi:hypothetical protein